MASLNDNQPSLNPPQPLFEIIGPSRKKNSIFVGSVTTGAPPDPSITSLHLHSDGSHMNFNSRNLIDESPNTLTTRLDFSKLKLNI